MNELTTPEDFYNFYDAIPEELWCMGSWHHGQQHCAIGHLGQTSNEAKELDSIFTNGCIKKTIPDWDIVDCNDGKSKYKDYAPTPKKRILKALRAMMEEGM